MRSVLEAGPLRARAFASAALSGVAVALALLTGAPAAQAHTGSPASVASNYEARLRGFRPPVAGLTAKVSGGDIDLEVHAPAGRQVLVLGDEGEPFLRFEGGRVFANVHSATAAADRVLRSSNEALSGSPIWHELRSGRSFRWHEHRLRPASSTRDGPVAPISIPLRVDRVPVMLIGTSWHARPPSPLWWLVPVLALCTAAIAALRWRGEVTRRLVLPLAVVVVAAVLASIVGTTLYAPHSALSAGGEIAAAGLLGFGAILALVLVPAGQRAFVATATGTVSVLFAFSALPVLTHGFALSRLPTDVARGATAVALAAGGLVVLIGGVELFDLSARSGSRGRGQSGPRSRRAATRRVRL